MAKSVLTDTTAIDSQISELLREIEVITELTKKCVNENAATARDQTEYLNTYNGYVELYDKAKARYDDLQEQRNIRLTKRRAIERFIHTLAKREGLLTEFDNCLWLTTVDQVLVETDGRLLFRFFAGTEIYG